MEKKLIELESTDSTNRYLIDMAKEGAPCGTTVWAHRQTGGRGRLGRNFSSPTGGIYISFLLPLANNLLDNLLDVGFSLTAMAGVAVKRTIWQVCGKVSGIKWVNDVMLDGKKVSGILAQVVMDKVVIGIGINYNTPEEDFPPEVRQVATSIYNKGQEAPPMAEFVKKLTENIYAVCSGSDKNWLKEYKDSSTIVGNKVQIIQAGKIVGEGLATSIDDRCFLHVIDDDGNEIVLSTGEVSIRQEGRV